MTLPSSSEISPTVPEEINIQATTFKVSNDQLTQQVDLISNAIKSAKDKKAVEAILFKHYNEKALDYVCIYYGTVDGNFTCAPKLELPPDYDFRQRPPYLDALSKGSNFSEPYTDAVSGKTILTLSKPVYVDKKLIGVIGIDVYAN
jgi:hypothetical protein